MFDHSKMWAAACCLAVTCNVALPQSGVACNDPIKRIPFCDLPAKIYLKNPPIGDGCGSGVQVLEDAIDVWNAASSEYDFFEYAGTIGGGLTSTCDGDGDFFNVLFNTTDEPTKLAQACTCRHESKDHEFDIEINYNGSLILPLDCTGSPDSTENDYLSLLLHELGHCLGLQHSSGGIMGTGQLPGVTQTLTQSDIDNVNALYHSGYSGGIVIDNSAVAQTFDENSLAWDVTISFDTNLSTDAFVLFSAADEIGECDLAQTTTIEHEVLHTIVLEDLPSSTDFCAEIHASSNQSTASCMPSESLSFTTGSLPGIVVATNNAPGSPVISCPQGDAGVVTVDLDLPEPLFSGTIAASRLTLQSANGDLVVYPTAGVAASSDATDGNGHTTQFQVDSVSGCATGSFALALDGVRVASIDVSVRSHDTIPNGRVDLAEIGGYSATYGKCPSDPSYDACFDYAGDTCINLVDHGQFSAHIWHQSAEYGTRQPQPGPLSADIDRGAPGARIEWVRPNPTSGHATIQFAIPESAPVHLAIYNLRGELVETLVDEHRSAGAYSATWTGRPHGAGPVAAGMFFARLTAGQATFTRKITVLR